MTRTTLFFGAVLLADMNQIRRCLALIGLALALTGWSTGSAAWHKGVYHKEPEPWGGQSELGSAQQDETDKGDTDQKAVRPASDLGEEEALLLTPTDLALAFLVAAEITSGGTVLVYELCKQSGPPCMTAQQILHYPDGTTETVTLKTFEELEQFVTKWQRLHGEYKKEIMQRGFKRMAPSYDATVSRGCSDKCGIR